MRVLLFLAAGVKFHSGTVNGDVASRGIAMARHRRPFIAGLQKINPFTPAVAEKRRRAGCSCGSRRYRPRRWNTLFSL
ncbi:hypothetical protein KIN20_001029 [Parelaphostrongylus tenuis]|uniref:Uncharacterized protein n=1 Tax=Parelaphostrongylus tenuis TaxID=148309 RepID=A0AAD5LTG4_PARTN|nr:hypothetical protein KIN20_001029 [Parelaphostrongylus tenuis]